MAKPKAELIATKRTNAMPEVEKLVARFGRPVIGWCLNRLRAKERTKKQAAALRKQLRELSRKP